jgi:sugar lactone lactonase YvrE
VAVDVDGNVYISEYQGCKVRRVNVTTGIISTVAGTGVCGYGGDGGTALSAHLGLPNGLAVDDARQRLYVADLGNNRVRAVNLSSGLISTVAGTAHDVWWFDGWAPTAASLNMPRDVEVDAVSGNLYILERFRILKVVF